MKVYTKVGDKGQTALYGGDEVSKDHPRLAAYGTVDELNSVIGWLRAVDLDADMALLLEQAQNILFTIGAQLATPDESRLAGRSRSVSEQDVTALERAIDEWDKELAPLKQFILPGGAEGACRAHLVRAVTRRAERAVVALKQSCEVAPEIIKYLNRLSDFAFVMARVINHRAGIADVDWKKA